MNKEIRLGEICDFTQGIQIPDSETTKKHEQGYIRYLYIRDFFTDKFKTFVKDIYPHKVMTEKEIMMVNTGNTAGEVYRGKKGVLCNNAFKISIKEGFKDNISTEYLWQFLISNFGKQQLKRLFNSGGQPHVGHKNIAKIKFPLKDFNDQKKIADILSTWDKAIDLMERLIHAKENLKKRLMWKLFGDMTYKKWKKGFLGDYCEVITKGTTPTTLGFSYLEKGVNFIKIESINDNAELIPNKLSHISDEAHRVLKRSEIMDNDILFSIAGALGRLTIVSKEFLPANTNQALAIIRVKKNSKLRNRFLYYFLRSSRIREHIRKINVRAAQANLSLRDIANLKVPLPSIEEQRKIEQALFVIDDEYRLVLKKTKKLKKQKQALMQKLLTGKIRVGKKRVRK